MFAPEKNVEKDIGKIKKNDTTEIIVRLDDFGGKKGLTIREFVKSDRYTGFTKSGVRILAENFPSFKKMIDSITAKDLEESAQEPKEAKQKSMKEESEEEMMDY